MTGNPETPTNVDVMKKVADLYCELMTHDGYGDIRIEMKILRRQQKEIIIHCGKQYRYVVDFAGEDEVGCQARSLVA